MVLIYTLREMEGSQSSTRGVKGAGVRRRLLCAVGMRLVRASPAMCKAGALPAAMHMRQRCRGHEISELFVWGGWVAARTGT
jgi:hypothetical protein